MNCPSCSEVKLLMTERQDIEIDYCPQCRGVWLDRGELDKIIDRSLASGPAGASPLRRDDNERRGHQERRDYPHGQQEPPHGGSYKKKKREGFLSDLFDFD